MRSGNNMILIVIQTIGIAYMNPLWVALSHVFIDWWSVLNVAHSLVQLVVVIKAIAPFNRSLWPLWLHLLAIIEESGRTRIIKAHLGYILFGILVAAKPKKYIFVLKIPLLIDPVVNLHVFRGLNYNWTQPIDIF